MTTIYIRVAVVRSRGTGTGNGEGTDGLHSRARKSRHGWPKNNVVRTTFELLTLIDQNLAGCNMVAPAELTGSVFRHSDEMGGSYL